MLCFVQLAAEEAALGRGGKGLRGAERVAAAKAMSVDKLAAHLETASTTESVEGPCSFTSSSFALIT